MGSALTFDDDLSFCTTILLKPQRFDFIQYIGAQHTRHPQLSRPVSWLYLSFPAESLERQNARMGPGGCLLECDSGWLLREELSQERTRTRRGRSQSSTGS
jgi:hypothetical protein